MGDGGGGGGGKRYVGRWPPCQIIGGLPPAPSLSLSLSLPTALLILSFHAYFAVESITPKF